MLTLIPATIGPEYKSNAEKKVFQWLKECSSDGYAFHSVGLSEHEEKSNTESDFIVVTRNGILCLEVKGGRVFCENGVWGFENKHGKIDYKNEGPFDQATGAMYALKKALTDKFPWLHKVSFANGVVFTDITFDYRGVSVRPEIMFDYSSSMRFDDYMEQCHNYWDSKHRTRYSYLTEEEIEQIKSAIRDDLHFVPSLSCVVNSIDEQLVRLTEEQISILSALEENDKILINGPAGSGKTLIAMEFARRCAKQSKRVLFLTYNKLLAQYLSNLTNDENIKIAHFHGLISQYVALDTTKMSDPNYFGKVLPDKFLQVLSANKVAPFDVLIIDEGQDLLNSAYFAIFEKLLKKGLYSGKWMFFYDTNQNLFGGGKFQRSLDALKRYNPVNFKLTKNCRNTEPIARFNKYSSGIEPGKAMVDGEQVEILEYFDDFIDDVFDGLIHNLLQAGISMDEITIISPYTLEKSVLNRYHGKYKANITKFIGNRDSDKLCVSTIQSFKGLDSKIVIALDLDNTIESEKSIVLYTLLSRARAMLYIISEQAVADKLRVKVIKSINESA